MKDQRHFTSSCEHQTARTTRSPVTRSPSFEMSCHERALYFPLSSPQPFLIKPQPSFSPLSFPSFLFFFFFFAHLQHNLSFLQLHHSSHPFISNNKQKTRSLLPYIPLLKTDIHPISHSLRSHDLHHCCRCTSTPSRYHPPTRVRCFPRVLKPESRGRKLHSTRGRRLLAGPTRASPDLRSLRG